MAEPAEEESPLIITGRCITLENGARVWGGKQDDSVLWRFTSLSGAITSLSLSCDAMQAVIQLFQGLIGCDEDFARVDIEAPKQQDKP